MLARLDVIAICSIGGESDVGDGMLKVIVPLNFLTLICVIIDVLPITYIDYK